MTEEAGEVVRAVGAWVVVFRRGVLMLDGQGVGHGNEGTMRKGRDDGREAGKGGDGNAGGEEEQPSGMQRGRGDMNSTAQPPSQPGTHTTEPNTPPRPRLWRRQHVLALLSSIASIISHAHSSASEPWDGVLLAVGMPGGLVSSTSASTSTIADEAALADEWEDACFEAGFEYVDCGGAGSGIRSGGGSSRSERRVDELDEDMGQRNEFGEVSGVARVRQALEACEWEDVELQLGGQEYDDDDLSGGHSGGLGNGRVAGKGDAEDDLAWLDDEVDFGSFGRAGVLDPSRASGGATRSRTEAAAALLHSEKGDGEEIDGEMDSEMRSGRLGQTAEPGQGQEVSQSESEQDVESLDVLLRKVLAVKEMSGHLSEGERRRMARRLVQEVMGGDG